jgi:hypothetical protein
MMVAPATMRGHLSMGEASNEAKKLHLACHRRGGAYRLAGPVSASLTISSQHNCPLLRFAQRDRHNPSALYERRGTRLFAHALNPKMQRASIAKTATLNSASIMFPSTERIVS